MRTGEPDLYESARNAHYLDHWAFEPHMESIPGSSAGASRQVRHRRTQYPPIKAQPSVQPGTLSKKLRAARIGYVHLRNLGGLRHARRDSPNMGWRNASFRGFADYMQTADFEAGLHRLMKLARQKRSAIMCAEAVPWRCHRSLIADALTVRGIHVDDIMSMKRCQVHSLIPFARVQGHRITYPIRNRGGGRFPLVRFPKSLRKNRKTKV
jgi:Protein of unknown function, DUF488